MEATSTKIVKLSTTFAGFAAACDGELTGDGERFAHPDGSFAMEVVTDLGNIGTVVTFTYNADLYDSPEDWLTGPCFAGVAEIVR